MCVSLSRWGQTDGPNPQIPNAPDGLRLVRVVRVRLQQQLVLAAVVVVAGHRDAVARGRQRARLGGRVCPHRQGLRVVLLVV